MPKIQEMFKKPQNPVRPSKVAKQRGSNSEATHEIASADLRSQRKRTQPDRNADGKRMCLAGNLQATNDIQMMEKNKIRSPAQSQHNTSAAERLVVNTEVREKSSAELHITNAQQVPTKNSGPSKSRAFTSQQPVDALSAQLENSTIIRAQRCARKSNRKELNSMQQSNPQIHIATQPVRAKQPHSTPSPGSNIVLPPNAHPANQQGGMRGELVGHIAVRSELSARFLNALCALEGRVALLSTSVGVCVQLQLVKRLFAQQMRPDLLEFAILNVLRLAIRAATAEELVLYWQVNGGDANTHNEMCEFIPLNDFLDRLPDLLDAFRLSI